MRRIASDLNLRNAKDTSALTYEHIPTEVQPILNSLNLLFVRIGSLLEQERAFVANAAHELRTPLAGLRIQAEVMGMCNDDPIAQEKALQKILQASSKCSQLVEQLLLLSQLETKFSSIEEYKQDPHMLEPILWEKLILDAYNEAIDQAKEKHIELSYDISAKPAPQNGIPSLWGIVLRNMLDNAIKHSPPNSCVHISLYAKALCVENSNVNIDADILPKLGKRFYRPAGQDTTGSGLGLAIINHICMLHGATFSLDNILPNTICNTAPKQFTPHKSNENAVIACVRF